MKLFSRIDSRDFHFHKHFGAVTDFPLEVNFDKPIVDDIQPPGDTHCTEFSFYDVSTDVLELKFVKGDLFDRTPHNEYGAEVRDILKEGIDGGILPVGTTTRIKPYKSYWTAHTGDMDAFDNTRSAFLIANRPILCYSGWYREWLTGDILKEGKNIATYHMYVIEGWKVINGETYFIIEAWMGRKVYMSRAIFNQIMKTIGSGTAVLSDVEIDGKRIKTLSEKLRDLLINLVLLYQRLIVVKKETPVIIPEPIIPKRDLLTEFCMVITDYEGLKFNPKIGGPDLNWQNNNPGNCVYSSKGYDPKYGKVTKRGRFAVFPTWELGFLYLKNLVILKSKENPTWTIYDYFALSHAPKSDGNDPKAYAQFVANELRILITTKLRDLV